MWTAVHLEVFVARSQPFHICRLPASMMQASDGKANCVRISTKLRSSRHTDLAMLPALLGRARCLSMFALCLAGLHLSFRLLAPGF